MVTTDQLGYIDLSQLDAAVVLDTSRLPERSYFPLLKSEVFPVCSPDFLSAHAQATDNLSSVPPELFLHFDVGDSGFMTWPKWFALVGMDPPAFGVSSTFDAYPFLLQAVLRGEGIGLGRHGLVDQALAKGDILRIGPKLSDRKVSYFLQHRAVRNENGLLAQMLDRFRMATADQECAT